jgi:hypothetical protein
MRWYHYLNKIGEDNLMGSEKIDDENLIVCQQLSTRRYTHFQNFSAFFRYYQTLPESERCFYEILLPEKARKPYFDIDMEREKIKDFDEKELFREVRKIFREFLGKEYTLLVFSSHTEKKRSYHLIIDDFVLQNYKECEVFFDRFTDRLTEKYKPYFDRCVYKSVQQFRIIGNHKFEKDNSKKFEKELSVGFKYPSRCREKNAKFLHLLSVSLIYNNSYCQMLGGFSPPEEEKSLGMGAACEGDVADVLQNFFAVYSPDDFQYSSCKEQNGNLLLVLRRLNPTYCKECDRVHENENPFITVTGGYRNITFYCRRKDEKLGVNLGYLGPPVIPELTSKDITIIDSLSEIVEKNKETEEHKKMRELLEREEEILKDIPDLEEDLEEMSTSNIKPLTPKRKENRFSPKKLSSYRKGSILPKL